MIPVLRAEALRLRTVRSPLLACALVVVAVGALMVALSAAAPAADADEVVGQGLALAASLCGIVIALLSASGAGADFQHGTAVPAFLSRPRRRDILLARAGVHAAMGFVVGGLGVLVGMVAATATAARRDVDLGGAFPLWLPLGVAAGTAAAGVMGVAVGMWLRSSVAAILTVIGVVTLAEPLVGSVVPGYLLPFGALGVLAASAGAAPTFAAGAVLACWTALLVGLSARSLTRTDLLT